MTHPLGVLRHHVSGAIARGEKTAITEKREEPAFSVVIRDKATQARELDAIVTGNQALGQFLLDNLQDGQVANIVRNN